MTDKQIIIDGVDVSGCRAYYKEYYITDMCSLADGLTCAENPNCYYKQLKRKEQKCERLKHDNDYEVGALEGTIENLKAENEKLETENKKLVAELANPVFDSFEELDQLKAERVHLKNKIMHYEEIFRRNIKGFYTGAEATEFANILQYLRDGLITEENYKLKQTLIEIKELLLKTPTDSQKHCINAKSVILQKISECEGNDE